MVGVGASGVLVNQFNQVLLILRDDTRTWAPPGGALLPNELPDAGTAREVREESGLIVLPVRLVSVHFTPFQPTPLIGFTFRCIQRGGELQTSEESPNVGFFKATELPRRIANFHKVRLEKALTHRQETAVWYTTPLPWTTRLMRQFLLKVVYPYKDWQRQRRSQLPYDPPKLWRISAFTAIQNEAGEVLWQQSGDGWQLPGGASAEQEPPWETAVRHAKASTGQDVSLKQLSGVYVNKIGEPEMVFVYTAVVPNATDTPNARFYSADAPPQTTPHQQQWLADALSQSNITLFKHF